MTAAMGRQWQNLRAFVSARASFVPKLIMQLVKVDIGGDRIQYPPDGSDRPAPPSRPAPAVRRGQTCGRSGAAGNAERRESGQASAFGRKSSCGRRRPSAANPVKPAPLSRSRCRRLLHALRTVPPPSPRPAGGAQPNRAAAAGSAGPERRSAAAPTASQRPPRAAAARPAASAGFRSQWLESKESRRAAREPRSSRTRSNCRRAARRAPAIRWSSSATPSSASSCSGGRRRASCCLSASSASSSRGRCRRIASSTFRAAPACATSPMCSRAKASSTSLGFSSAACWCSRRARISRPANISSRRIRACATSSRPWSRARWSTHQVGVPEGLTSEQIVARLLDDDVLTGDIKEIPREGSLAARHL